MGKYKLYCETPPAPVGHFALFAEIQNLKYQPVPPTHPHQSLCSLTQTSLFLIIDELPNHPRPLLVQVQLSCRSGCLMEQSSLTSATAVGHCLPVPLVLVSLAWGWMALSPCFSGVSFCQVGLVVCGSALAPAQHRSLQMPVLCSQGFISVNCHPFAASPDSN